MHPCFQVIDFQVFFSAQQITNEGCWPLSCYSRQKQWKDFLKNRKKVMEVLDLLVLRHWLKFHFDILLQTLHEITENTVAQREKAVQLRWKNHVDQRIKDIQTMKLIYYSIEKLLRKIGNCHHNLPISFKAFKTIYVKDADEAIWLGILPYGMIDFSHQPEFYTKKYNPIRVSYPSESNLLFPWNQPETKHLTSQTSESKWSWLNHPYLWMHYEDQDSSW